MIVRGKETLKNRVESLMLIQLGDIGDVIVSIPCIRALREFFPEAKIAVAVWDKAAELLRDLPEVDDVLSVERKRGSLPEMIRYHSNSYFRLRRLKTDLAIDLRMGTRGGIMALLSGAGQRLSVYDTRGRSRNHLFTHLCLPEVRPGQHMAEVCLGLLEQYGISTEDKKPRLHVGSGMDERALHLLDQEGIGPDENLVAVQPFSLWAYKDWGVHRYIELIDWMGSAYGFEVLITGSQSEKEKADEIVSKSSGRVHNMAGRTSIGELAALLKRCRLFAGGDSAGLHIAAAVGTPTVGIYGPSSHEAWAPRGEKHCVVCMDMPCMPCSRKGCNDSGISRCLDELSWEAAFPLIDGHIRKILKRGSYRA